MRIWLISSYICQNSRIIKKVSQLKYVYTLFRGFYLSCITRELEKALTPILKPCTPKWVCHFNHRITVRGTAERFWIQLQYPASNGIDGWDIWHDSGNKVYEWWEWDFPWALSPESVVFLPESNRVCNNPTGDILQKVIMEFLQKAFSRERFVTTSLFFRMCEIASKTEMANHNCDRLQNGYKISLCLNVLCFALWQTPFLHPVKLSWPCDLYLKQPFKSTCE